MEHSNSTKELQILIKSDHPLVYVVSNDEKPVVRCVKEMVASSKVEYDIFTWNSITGFYQEHRDENPISKDNKKLIEDKEKSTMFRISEYQGNAIFILYDYHPWLVEKETGTLSRIKEITLKSVAHQMGDSTVDRFYQKDKTWKKQIIVVSSVLRIPSELSHLFTIVYFELPNREEVGEMLNSFLVREKVKVHPNANERNEIINSSLGMSEKEIYYTYKKSLFKNEGKLNPRDISDEKRLIVQKQGLLDFIEAKVEVEDVGGLKELLHWTKKRKIAYNEEIRIKNKLMLPKGILMTGIQGCGKSHASKAIATHLEMPLLRLDVGSMMGWKLGESEGNLRKAIQLAESIAPCVLWIDEIDKSLPDPKNTNTHETTKRMFSYLLTWLQEKTSSVFVVATANNIFNLPPELMRKGRFDEIFFIDLPSREEREEILKIHLRRRELIDFEIDIKLLAEVTKGFSGAEIENVLNEALFEAAYSEENLHTKHLLEEIEKTRPLSKTMEEEIREIRKWAKEHDIRRASAESDLDDIPKIGF